jgi:hypothetical protein
MENRREHEAREVHRLRKRLTCVLGEKALSISGSSKWLFLDK